jgi:hypothetical protein
LALVEPVRRMRAWQAAERQRAEPMHKTQAIESLGQHRLMLPTWVKAALAANDRIKVYLTVVQEAAARASHPNRALPDLSAEIAAAGLKTTCCPICRTWSCASGRTSS